jgi:hypothetical protein
LAPLFLFIKAWFLSVKSHCDFISSVQEKITLRINFFCSRKDTANQRSHSRRDFEKRWEIFLHLNKNKLITLLKILTCH